jgi:DNA-binding CsgD family transcriptional regulator
MPRHPNPRTRALRAVETLLRSGLPPEPLAARLVAALRLAFPADGFRLFGLDPATILINRLLAASDDDAWARREWLRDVYLAEPLPYMNHSFLIRRGVRSVAFSERVEICWGYPGDVLATVPPREHRRRFRDGGSPVGGTLIVHFASREESIAVLQLYRRDAARPFQAEDVAFVDRLAAPIGSALGAALARERAALQPGGDDASGIVFLSPGQTVVTSTPAAERWLARLRDADRGGHAPMPTPVWTAMAALRAEPWRTMVALDAATENGAIRVEASPAEPDGSVAVVLAPVRPPALPALPVSWDLTPAERRAIQLVTRGLGNREIAARLSLSEHTVEWHLRHAYEKIGARGRNELLVRFFAETLFPTLVLDPVSEG